MSHLNYHHFYYFFIVCQERSFTQAALKLRISQSAVSEQVKRLEDLLGQKLIERTTRRFELTESGKVAEKYAELIFGAGQELIDLMLHRPQKGIKRIRVGALSTLSRNLQIQFLEPILDRQDVSFDLMVGDSKKLVKLLKDHEIDLILSTFPVSEGDSGKLYTHLLMESPLCLVSNQPRGRQSFEESLRSERIYLPSSTFESRADFDYFVESKKMSLNIAGQVEDVALLRLLALRGNGLALVPRIGVVHDLEDRSLFVIHEFSRIKQKYYAITRQKKYPNALIAELVRFSGWGE